MTLDAPSLLRRQCCIDGARCDAGGGETIAVAHAATDEAPGAAPMTGAAGTCRVIEAAARARPSGAAGDRSLLPRRRHDPVTGGQGDLPVPMTAAQGGPLSESRGGIGGGVLPVDRFAAAARRVCGAAARRQAGRRIPALGQPVGVCAAIASRNVPDAMTAGKADPALAAGCPMAPAPASTTPFPAPAPAGSGERAGIPKRVLAVAAGASDAIGAGMTGSPVVRKPSFTGPTGTGKAPMTPGARAIRAVSPALGGDAPCIMFGDAGPDAAADGATARPCRSPGRARVDANRLPTRSGAHEDLVAGSGRAVSAMADDTGSGLAARFRIRDLGTAWRVSEGLEYGIVGADTGSISTAEAPFGGVEEAGIGRDGPPCGVGDCPDVGYLRVAVG